MKFTTGKINVIGGIIWTRRFLQTFHWSEARPLTGCTDPQNKCTCLGTHALPFTQIWLPTLICEKNTESPKWRWMWFQLRVWMASVGSAAECSLCPCSCFNSCILARLGMFCMSSGSSLWCFVDGEALDFKACVVFEGWAGGPDFRSSVWAAGLHPVPGSSPLRDRPPRLGSQDSICCSAEPKTTAVFPSGAPSVLRSSKQVLWGSGSGSGLGLEASLRGFFWISPDVELLSSSVPSE